MSQDRPVSSLLQSVVRKRICSSSSSASQTHYSSSSSFSRWFSSWQSSCSCWTPWSSKLWLWVQKLTNGLAGVIAITAYLHDHVLLISDFTILSTIPTPNGMLSSVRLQPALYKPRVLLLITRIILRLLKLTKSSMWEKHSIIMYVRLVKQDI